MSGNPETRVRRHKAFVAISFAVALSSFAGRSEAQCSSVVYNSSQAFSANGGTGTLYVEIPNGCAWTAGSSLPWVTITSGASGNGSGLVTFTVGANVGATYRGGNLFAAGRSTTVNQRPAILGGTFSDMRPKLPWVLHYGTVAWADYDGDGDMDALVTGETDSNPNVMKKLTILYRNDGANQFADVAANLVGVNQSAVAWGDYDNDGDLDLLLAGSTMSVNVSKVYRNDGGTFTDTGAPLVPVYQPGVAWGDYDNDGDLDILLTGYRGDIDIAKIYRNDGGVFSDIAADIGISSNGAALWGDYDNDGDLDILLNGYGSGAKIYRNDGGGAFTNITAGLQGSGNQAGAAWGDYDNDGDLDVLVMGPSWLVYRNDAGAFVNINAGLPNLTYGSGIWGDYDHDGDLDILLTGELSGSGSNTFSRIYRNDGAGVFTLATSGLIGVGVSRAAFGDYDADGDLDVLLTGPASFDGGFGGYGHVDTVFRNDTPGTNTPPGKPAGLQSVPSASQVSLAWGAAADAQTPAAGLTYNLRVGTTPGGGQVVSPMANPVTGQRAVAQLGNTNHRRNAVLSGLAPGTYYWSVQAIDTEFAGGPFADEATFTIAAPALSVGDVSVVEGPTGTKNAVFTVTLAPASPATVTVSYATADGSAKAGSDYVAAGGTLTFAANATTQTVDVAVNGDRLRETNETFALNLTNPTGATLGDAQGMATVENDDLGGPGGDLGGDGKADIMWRKTGAGVDKGAVFLWTMDGTALAGARYLDPISEDWQAQFTGDFNGDGKGDVLWRNLGSGADAGKLYLWIMDGPNVVAGTGYTASQADLGWRVDGVGDLNGDGKADIVWRKTGAGVDKGAVFLWTMDGTGISNARYLDPISEDWQVVDLGDFDGDGKTDVLWRNMNASSPDAGKLYVWIMDGPNVVAGTGYTASQADLGWRVDGVGDLNGDGKDDIVWRKTGAGVDKGAVFLWTMDGTGISNARYLDPISEDWQVQGLGDFNGDGKTDVLWRNMTSASADAGKLYVWIMDGPNVVAGTGYTASQADLGWRVDSPRK
jgi:hypothetical protein